MAQTFETREDQTTSLSAEAVARCRSPHEAMPKIVLVHSGARDSYQLASAFSERGLLKFLVTDLFWPENHPLAQSFTRKLPLKLQALLRQRSEGSVPSAQVRLCAFVGILTFLLEKIPGVPMALRRSIMRYADAHLGRRAGELARRRQMNLVSYSYYAYDAFRSFGKPGVLFQLHPHPSTMRRILTEELEANPDCAASLKQEWELSLPEKDFDHLVLEPAMASHIIVASSFTKTSLTEHGISPSLISVVPYGVDSARFIPASPSCVEHGPRLNLLFVGRINQRKGIKYLLQALHILNRQDVHLTVCGRVVDGLELFEPFSTQVTVRPSVSADELVKAYQSADLFVFPSVAEGFGQVLLEALACGLPVLSTTRTGAPDLIEDGVQGFIVEPRRPDLIAERIEWAINHRQELTQMSQHARLRAEHFSWSRFRAQVADITEDFFTRQADRSEGRQFHV